MKKTMQVGISQGKNVVFAPAVVWVPISVEVSPSTGPIHPPLSHLPCQRSSAVAATHKSKFGLQCSWDEIALKINSFERLGPRARLGPFSPLEMAAAM